MAFMGPDGRGATLAELCLHAADLHGRATAVFDGSDGLSYADLGRRATAAAHSLRAAGVHPGDRVLISAPNSVGWVAAAFGVSLAGATIVPVNDRVTGAELHQVVEALRPMLVIGDLRGDLVGGDLGVRVIALADVLDRTRPQGHLPTVTSDMTALVMQTSGTTGVAKSVPMQHGPLTGLYTDLSRRIGLRPSDVLLGPVPLAHGFGLFGVLLDGLLAGACVRLVRHYDREGIADLVVDEEVTALFAPPTVFHDLLVSGRTDIGNSCRIALTGGAEVSLPRFRETCDALGVPRRLVGYGMTEAYGAIAFGDVTGQRDDALPRLTPLPGVEVRTVEGEVQARGPSVVAGVVAGVEAGVVGAGGWLHTGDLGRLTPEGELVVMSRLADTVIVSGFNVSPVEVEDALRSHPGVDDAVVLGVPDERQGEQLVGCVVMDSGNPFDRAALEVTCRARLSPYKVPAELIELTAFPTTHTGKRSRAALRDLVLRRMGP